MTKITAVLLGFAAAAVALVLLLLGWRRLHVDEGAARTLRGRFLVAVAFFLAVFGGAVDRAFSADRPPAVTKQQLSLADMQNAVQAIFLRGPASNDWSDPAIRPNVRTTLTTLGLLKAGPQVMCYDRAAVPVKARGEEIARLQKQLLNEKVKAGVIPEEVGRKITALPEWTPATPREVRLYQQKVRRITRLLYKAGELDSATIKQLETAIRIPIARLDPMKALTADVTYVLQARAPWQWPPQARKEFLAMLARRGVINKIKTRRGEVRRYGKVAPEQLDKARAQINKVAALIADPNHTVTLKQDGKAAKQIAMTRLTMYAMNVRRVVRILIAERILRTYDARSLTAVLGVPVLGKVTLRVPPRMCYAPMPPPKKSSSLTPEQRREMRAAFNDAGILDDRILAKLDNADAERG